MKTYGYKTLGSLVLFLFWMSIYVDKPSIYIPVVIGTAIIAMLFAPLIRLGDGRIRLLTLNPFTTRINLAYEDISKIQVHAGDIRFSMRFELKDGSIKTTSSFFRYYDMEALYEELRATGIPVTSTGVRAVSWKS